MAARTAILSFRGALPRLLAAAAPQALIVTFAGVGEVAAPPPGRDHLRARFERLGALFDALRDHGVGEVVFAGALSRPALDAAQFDARTAQVMPTVMQAMQGGDDGLLRAVVALFEAEGFAVVAPHALGPGLLLPAGTSWGRAPDQVQSDDAARAFDILAALGPLDVAQGAVVEAGLCLGVETVQGTDAMLDFVAATDPGLRRGRGVFAKAPKAGQDLRVDMPAIGPGTIDAVARAGLAGLVIAAGAVLVLDQAEVRRRIAAHDLFLVAR